MFVYLYLYLVFLFFFFLLYTKLYTPLTIHAYIYAWLHGVAVDTFGIFAHSAHLHMQLYYNMSVATATINVKASL